MPEVTLELLGELMRRMMEKQDRMQDQQGRIQEQLDRMRDDMLVLTGVATRLEGLNEGLPLEVRGLRLRQERLVREVDRLGERIGRLEGVDPV